MNPESGPIPFIVVETVPNREQPAYGDLETKSLHENKAKRSEDAQPDAEWERTSPAAIQSDEPAFETTTDHAIPTLIVEKTGTEPRHGDDMGPDATTGQKLAHEMRKADSEPNKVVILSPNHEDNKSLLSRYPEFAAAVNHPSEYAPTPEVDRVPLFAHEAFANQDNDLATPSLAHDEDPEKLDAREIDESIRHRESLHGAPLFAHECSSEESLTKLPSRTLSRSHNSNRSSTSLRSFGDDDDINDPALEQFPTDREAIYQQITRTETRLAEDDSVPEPVSPPSPIFHREKSSGSKSRVPSVISTGFSLKPIEEDEFDQEDVLILPAVAIPPSHNKETSMNDSNWNQGNQQTSPVQPHPTANQDNRTASRSPPKPDKVV
jgi:hypothetical protein